MSYHMSICMIDRPLPHSRPGWTSLCSPSHLLLSLSILLYTKTLQQKSQRIQQE